MELLEQDEYTHEGSRVGYRDGCRCDGCRNAERAYQRDLYDRRKRGIADHGVRSTYVKGCRCGDCREANRRYERDRNNARPTIVPDWTNAKCSSEQPQLWDLDFYEQVNDPFMSWGDAMRPSQRAVKPTETRYELVRDREQTDRDAYAKRLCAGCPLLKECAQDAQIPMYWDEFGAVYVSGVIRAGVAVTDAARRDVRRKLAKVS